MKLRLDSENMEDYLEASSIIDYDHSIIKEFIAQCDLKDKTELELIKFFFEYVRDYIDHSADIQGKVVTCKASEVLTYKEGICYPKSHLLAALLRYHGFPTGFCYQKLIICRETANYIVLHGLNAVYIPSMKQWIRLDARGNKEGVNAQFSVDQELLAFDIDLEIGEEDNRIIYHKPDKNIVETLEKYDTVEKLFSNLPSDLYLE